MDFFTLEYWMMLLRLVVAVILGGVIGFERAENKHDAGLRTHILVCLGSALIMVISEHLITTRSLQSDMMRMGAQVISGIGFLGIGCIITNGDKIKGLTTAAGLWTTAGVGLCVGIGYYSIAVTTVVLMLIVMAYLRPLAIRLKNRDLTVQIKVSSRVQVSGILDLLSEKSIHVNTVKMTEKGEHTYATVCIQLQHTNNYSQVLSELTAMEGVTEIH